MFKGIALTIVLFAFAGTVHKAIERSKTITINVDLNTGEITSEGIEFIQMSDERGQELLKDFLSEMTNGREVATNKSSRKGPN